MRLSLAVLVVALLAVLHGCTGEDPPVASENRADGGVALTVAVEPTVLSLAPGAVATLKVRVTRREDLAGTIVLTLDDPDFVVPRVEIAADADVVDVPLSVTPTAKLGAHVAQLVATFRDASIPTKLDITVRTTAGELDPTFGDGGVVVFESELADGGASLETVTIAGNGVIAGGQVARPNGAYEGAVLSLDATGTRERTFGVGGLVTTGYVSSTSIRALAREATGRIIGAGFKGGISSMLAVGLVPNGALDGDSFQLVGGSPPAIGLSAVAGNGTRFLGGALDGKAKVWKMTGANQVDASFAGNALTEGIPLPGHVARMLLDGDDRVTGLVDFGIFGPGTSALCLVRFLPGGGQDSTFGKNGLYLGDYAAQSLAMRGMARRGDALLLAGHRKGPTTQDLVLFEMDRDGKALVPAFGESGVVGIDVDGVNDFATDVAVDATGRIYATGYRDNGATREGFVLRLGTDARRDTTFGKDGVVAMPPAGQGAVNAIALGADGTIYVAGTATAAGRDTGFVARIAP